jgi:NADH-quinone oxidoreductase subunit B
MGLLNRLDHPYQGGGMFLGTFEDILNWGRSKSDWYLQFGLACCAIEFMALNASHFDLMRFGSIPRTSPRQADFIIVSGTVTLKMADRLVTLYEQMSEPRYILSMGSCSNSGGPYWEHGYHVLKGVDRILPVDVYVPGCPPRPEAFFEGMVKLQSMISKQAIFRKREKMSPEEIAELADRNRKQQEYVDRINSIVPVEGVDPLHHYSNYSIDFSKVKDIQEGKL